METLEDVLAFAARLPSATDADPDRLRELVQALATVTPPAYKAEWKMITLADFRDGGMSRKPGNILLNWRHFDEAFPEVGLAVVGATEGGAFGQTLTALYVWNKVTKGAEYKLNDAEASAIEAMWRHGARARRLPADDAFALTNELRRDRAVAALTRPEFERALDVLVRMRCINLTDGTIWLREWVRKRT